MTRNHNKKTHITTGRDEYAVFKNYPAELPNKKEGVVTIATGSLIIENNKVLLDKHGEDNFWKVPGGRYRDDLSFEENARYHTKEELGIDVKLVQGPYVFQFKKEKGENKGCVILVHYLGKPLNNGIKASKHVKNWGWFDIENLPDNLAPNIEPAIDFFKKYVK